MQDCQENSKPCALGGAMFTLSGQPFLTEITPLQDFLRANSQISVCLSAANLTKGDSFLFQYLIAAATRWRTRGLALEIVNVPPALETHFENLGISPDTIIRKSVL